MFKISSTIARETLKIIQTKSVRYGCCCCYVLIIKIYSPSGKFAERAKQESHTVTRRKESHKATCRYHENNTFRVRNGCKGLMAEFPRRPVCCLRATNTCCMEWQEAEPVMFGLIVQWALHARTADRQTACRQTRQTTVLIPDLRSGFSTAN